jgi:serine/threonine protein kinase
VNPKLILAYSLPIKETSIDGDSVIKFNMSPQLPTELVESEDEVIQSKDSPLSNAPTSEINPLIERYIEQDKYKNKYEELEVLNKSVLKEVCTARYIVDGNTYIIKKIHITLDNDQDLKQHNAYKEVEVMIKLNHQNVIRYMTCWLEKNRLRRSIHNKTSLTLYIQMEYGHSLKYWLKKRNCIDIKEVRSYFRQVMEGIRVIHSNGLVNGNISADSIFIDGEGNVRLGDFDLTAGRKNDVYAAGLLLLELCCLLKNERNKVVILQELKDKRVIPKELQGTPEGELILKMTEANNPSAEEIVSWLEIKVTNMV